MPRSLRTGTPIDFNPEIEKTIRKVKKEEGRQKQAAGFFGSSSSLPLVITTPQGSPLWNKPYRSFSSFQNVPPSSLS